MQQRTGGLGEGGGGEGLGGGGLGGLHASMDGAAAHGQAHCSPAQGRCVPDLSHLACPTPSLAAIERTEERGLEAAGSEMAAGVGAGCRHRRRVRGGNVISAGAPCTATLASPTLSCSLAALHSRGRRGWRGRRRVGGRRAWRPTCMRGRAAVHGRLLLHSSRLPSCTASDAAHGGEGLGGGGLGEGGGGGLGGGGLGGGGEGGGGLGDGGGGEGGGGLGGGGEGGGGEGGGGLGDGGGGEGGGGLGGGGLGGGGEGGGGLGGGGLGGGGEGGGGLGGGGLGGGGEGGCTRGVQTRRVSGPGLAGCRLPPQRQ